MKKLLPFETQLMQLMHEKKATSKGKQCELPVPLAPRMFMIGYANTTSWVSRDQDLITKKWTSTTLGKVGEMSLPEAVSALTILRDGLKAGRSPRESTITVGDYFDNHFCRVESGVAPSGRNRDNLSRFNCHIRRNLGNTMLSVVRQHHLLQLIEQLPKHLSIASINHLKTLLKALFKHAVEHGTLEHNPTAALKLQRTHNARQRIASLTEIQALCAPNDTESNPYPRLLNRLLFATGIRLSEALTAKFSDVKFDTGFLHLRMTKNGKPRAVPLSAEALAVIESLAAIRKNEYLFPGRSGGHMSRPSNALEAMKKQHGIEGLCYHDMRRTACSILINHSVPLLDASRFLGHSNTTVTQKHYAVLGSDRLHAAAELIGSVLRTAIGGGA